MTSSGKWLEHNKHNLRFEGQLTEIVLNADVKDNICTAFFDQIRNFYTFKGHLCTVTQPPI